MIHVWLNNIKIMHKYKTVEDFNKSADCEFFRRDFPDAPETLTNEYYARRDGTYYMFD